MTTPWEREEGELERPSSNTLWLRTAGFTLAVAALIVLGAFVVRPWIYDAHGAEVEQGNGQGKHAEDEEGASGVPVQVILPKLDPNLSVSVTQPAYVLPYYQIDLRARVAGPVLSVTKTIGDRVVSGEDLIRISVPDLVQDVARKAAIVKQREQELEVARAWRQKADADIQIALSTVKEKESDVRVADATAAFRKQELERFRGMAQRQGRHRQHRGGAAEVLPKPPRRTASPPGRSVDRAKAEVIGDRAKLLEAIADENLKGVPDPGREGRSRAGQGTAGFGTLQAPFDGVITRRNVDPGSFVQNSATGTPGPGLLTIEKMDIVTVYMNLPDNYAPYIDDKTEAIIEMSELPSIKIHALVTRFSPSLQTPGNDRTMRVEVDLYNRGAEDLRGVPGPGESEPVRRPQGRQTACLPGSEQEAQGETGHQAPDAGHVRQHEAGAAQVRERLSDPQPGDLQQGRQALHLPGAGQRRPPGGGERPGR